jgi:hypothetical protein
MRFVRRDVRDLIVHQKNGHGASYRRHGVMQRRSRLKFDFREIFGVVRFSTFATLSPQERISLVRSAKSERCQKRSYGKSSKEGPRMGMARRKSLADGVTVRFFSFCLVVSALRCVSTRPHQTRS